MYLKYRVGFFGIERSRFEEKFIVSWGGNLVKYGKERGRKSMRGNSRLFCILVFMISSFRWGWGSGGGSGFFV